jgi:hypothetical protein
MVSGYSDYGITCLSPVEALMYYLVMVRDLAIVCITIH